ncbi:hypothetical protein [Aquimarina agarilytica]|uniref:hypothetical protein n=1 Tax=Aquimarina agarilytica TaxID=1087449 RepID=UPI0002897451|nr:hypothetical protein [Aquimarina agarilytica]
MKAHTKHSFIETGKNVGSGIVGMLAGSAVGRYSLLIGVATTFGGAYYQKDWLTSLGVGMVASNGFSKTAPQAQINGVDGFQDELTNAKERATSSLKALGKKLYLDKLSPSLGQKLGLGNLEDSPLVFVGSEVADTGDFDTSEVDEIIRQLEEGSFEGDTSDIQGTPQIVMNTDPMEGMEEFGNLDIEELQGANDIMELNAVA